MGKIYSIFYYYLLPFSLELFFRETLLNHSCLEHTCSSRVFTIMNRAILEANGVSMVMMMLSGIKLFWGLIYIISGLSIHLSYHRHKKTNAKL